MATAAAYRARRSPSPARRPSLARRGIRWDRVGRIALLVTLGVIVLLYVAPVKNYFTQSRTAAAQREELRALESENARLESRLGDLRRPDAVEREARRLGMVKRGERAFVVEGLPDR
jgi:cell division protein FtsB